MKTIVVLEKRPYLLSLMQLFIEKDELNIRDIRKRIPSTTYYRDLLSRLLEINEIVEAAGSDYFVKPVFLKEEGKIFSGLQKNPLLSIQIKEKFVVLLHEKD